MTLPIPLNRQMSASLQEQIYQFIRDRIHDHSYVSGMKLPSSRDLAASLGVSRNTVVLAYEWLASEGYLESRAGAGAFVSKVVSDALALAPTRPTGMTSRSVRIQATAMPQPMLRTSVDDAPAFEFWYGRPDPRLFPTHVWRKLAQESLSVANAGIGAYGDQGGDRRLRQAIAGHLALTRGISALADQIIITAGAQEAINLVARLFVDDGVSVAIEQPGYQAAADVFASFGATLHAAPVDEEGLDLAGFRGTRPRLIYVTPSHQFPTGSVMSLARRRALLSYAAANEAIIVEDDYDGEIIFDRPPLAALSALDSNGLVFYLGSFSKSIGPGLRLGYLVVPRGHEDMAIRAKSQMSYGQSWLDQQVLAAFLEQGHFQRHLRRTRKLYRARRDAVTMALHAAFGPRVAIRGGDAGLHLLCVLPEGGPCAAEVSYAARGAGVGLYALEASGVFGALDDPAVRRTLLVGFAALAPEEIRTALERVRAKLAAGKQAKAASMDP